MLLGEKRNFEGLNNNGCSCPTEIGFEQLHHGIARSWVKELVINSWLVRPFVQVVDSRKQAS
jgi:hypothetical protein